jgi:hypothetical protein
VDQECKTAAKRRANLAESKAVGTQIARVRHRKALAEVQAAAALPVLEAKLAAAAAAQRKQLSVRLSAGNAGQSARPGGLQNKVPSNLHQTEKPCTQGHESNVTGHRVKREASQRKVASCSSEWHPVDFGLPPVDDVFADKVTVAWRRADMSAKAAASSLQPLSDSLPAGFFKDDTTAENQAGKLNNNSDSCTAVMQHQVQTHGTALPARSSACQEHLND